MTNYSSAAYQCFNYTINGEIFAGLNFRGSQEYCESFSMNIFCKLLIMALFECFKRKVLQKFSRGKLY